MKSYALESMFCQLLGMSGSNNTNQSEALLQWCNINNNATCKVQKLWTPKTQKIDVMILKFAWTFFGFTISKRFRQINDKKMSTDPDQAAFFLIGTLWSFAQTCLTIRVTVIWAASWQNQQNHCALWRLRSALASAKSDQSLRCLHEESLGP